MRSLTSVSDEPVEDAMSLTRRACLASLTGLVVAATPAFAQATTFRAVGVDIGPLKSRGLGPYADFVGERLQAAMAASFAGRIDRRASQTLVARVDTVLLAPDMGEFDAFGSPSDYMQGELLIMSGRALASRQPLVVSRSAALNRNIGLGDTERVRTAALASLFAAWAVRQV
jgi:hypothetical protein